MIKNISDSPVDKINITTDDNTSILCLEYKDLLKTSEASTWKTSFSKEFDRLSQGYHDAKG